MQKLARAVFGNNNTDTCARVCHSPTGYGLGQTFGTSAGTQDFDSVEKADVIVVIGANPTDAHPVFGSRMKQRLREGAKLDRHRPAPDRPGEVAAHRGRSSPAGPARHQRRHRVGARPCHRHRGALRRGLHPRALRLGRVPGLCRVHRRPAAQPRGDGGADRRRSRGGARRGAALCDRRQRRDLLRARGHRALPGLDRGHGHRQPRDADRQHRPRGRRREPAPGPEQRAGLVRHGLVPARAAGLPPPQERRRARRLRGDVGGRARRRAGAPHQQHARRRRRRHLPRGSTARARTSCSPTPTPGTSRPGSRRWTA